MLSIAICTYNRAESLRRMLESLQAQTFAEDDEVIVIDNCSSDNTRHVVEAFASLPLRYVFEPEQGLSHARNRALSEFAGAHLLFLDDDVRLEAGCLDAYGAAIGRWPEAGYFGGRILPDWSGPVPQWARSKLPLIDGLLVWLDLGDEDIPFSDASPGPLGASFMISRQLAARIGAFDTNLGCKGAGRGRGEETEWFLRAQRLGARGVYIAGAICYHRVDPERLRLPDLFAYGVESGAAHRRIFGERRAGSLLRLGSFALRGALQLMKGRGDRFRQCVINMGIEFDALRR